MTESDETVLELAQTTDGMEVIEPAEKYPPRHALNMTNGNTTANYVADEQWETLLQAHKVFQSWASPAYDELFIRSQLSIKTLGSVHG